MAFLDLMPSDRRMTFGFDAEKAFRVPIGAASPLWLAFAGVASVGVGFWWMSRLMKPMAAFALELAPPAEPTPMLAAPEPVVDAVMEAMAEPIAPFVDAVMEAAAEPVAMVEPPAAASFPVTEAMMAGVDAIADPIEELTPEPKSIPEATAAPRKAPRQPSAKPGPKRSN